MNSLKYKGRYCNSSLDSIFDASYYSGDCFTKFSNFPNIFFRKDILMIGYKASLSSSKNLRKNYCKACEDEFENAPYSDPEPLDRMK